jgi:hypothetical protein
MSYTGLLSDSYGDFSSTYDTGSVSAPDISVTSPVDSSTMTASELAGNGVDYSSNVSMNFDKFFAEQTDQIVGEAQNYLNGIELPDVQLEFGGDDSEGGMMANLWKEFKSLDGKTQSVLASTLFSAIGGVMKNDTAKETNQLNRERLDLERQKQNNAMQSTAESYDKSKYKVRGLLNPEAKLTYSTQTGVKK